MKNNYVLIKEYKPNRTTSSGLWLPDEKWNRFAKVIKSFDESLVKENDTIITNIGKSTIYEIGDCEYEAIHINDIIAVINE